MYQKDYILRMIEMLGEFIAGIMGFIKKGEFQKASQSLENAYYDLLKQDAPFFRNIDKENLTNELIQIHNYENGHLEVLSGLFYAEAELCYAKENYADSLVNYEKSLILYEFIIKESKTYSFEQQTKLTYLKEKISELSRKPI